MARQLVGDAYIRIFGDSRFLRDAIHRDSKRVGKEGAESLLDSFSDTIRKQADQRLKSAQLDLADAIAGGDFDRMLKRSGRSVTDFVSHIEADLRRFNQKGYFGKMKFDAQTFQKAMDELQDWAKRARATELSEQAELWEKANDRQMAEFRRMTDARERELLQQERDWNAANARQIAEFKKITAERNRELQAQERAWTIATQRQTAEFDRIIRDRSRAWETYGKNLLATEALAAKSEEATIRHTRAVERNTIAARFGWAEWRRYNQERLRALDINEEHETGLSRFSRTIDRSVILLNRHSESTGRMFGAGSRSEFLNFIGRVVGHMSRLPALVVAGFGRLAAFASDAVDQFRDLRELGTGAFRSLAIVGGRAMAALVPAIISAVVALASMSHLMPALISLFLLLAGAVTAVAGAISIGLVAGLLALTPLLGASLIGVGALAIGLTGLGDAAKATEKKLKPLKDSFASFRTFASDNLVNNLYRSFEKLEGVFKSMEPFVAAVNREFGNVVEHFLDLMTSPEMAPFVRAWGESIPKILGSLGKGISTLTAALTAFFTPILPYAERLATAFHDTMQTFLDWASSVEGQDTITEWMETAWGYASSLWEILKNVGSALGSVLTAGAEGPGKDFLGWLESVTGKWAEWLKTDEGQAEMKQFFEDVKTAMVTIKDVFSEVKDRMETIDWDQAIEDANSFLNAIRIAADAFSAVMETMYVAVALFRARFGVEMDSIVAIFDTVFGNGIVGILDAVGGMFILFYNKYVGPSFALVFDAIGTLMRQWGLLLLALGNVPGFEWATIAGTKMIEAAGKANDLADSIRFIPPTKLINVYLETKEAQANIASLKRALALIPDERVNVFVNTVNTALRGVPYGVKVGNTAAGGVFDEAQTRLIAEAGREAVVPLDRPLQMVDPTVRDLAAIAQGYAKPTATTSDGPNVHLEVHPGAFVLQNVSDPEVAAEMVVDRLAAAFRV